MFPVSLRAIEQMYCIIFICRFQLCVSSANIVFINTPKRLQQCTVNDKNICYTLMTVKHGLLFISNAEIIMKSLFNKVVSTSQCMDKIFLQISFPYKLSYLSLPQTTANIYNPLTVYAHHGLRQLYTKTKILFDFIRVKVFNTQISYIMI